MQGRDWGLISPGIITFPVTTVTCYMTHCTSGYLAGNHVLEWGLLSQFSPPYVVVGIWNHQTYYVYCVVVMPYIAHN